MGRRRSLATALAIALLAAGCGGEGDSGDERNGSKLANSGFVEAFDLGFRPARAVIERGSTVTWANVGQQIHNARQLPGSKERFFSRAIEPGRKYARSFSRKGRFPYFCSLHPQQMRGVVIVR